jgi:hypothetical protein
MGNAYPALPGIQGLEEERVSRRRTTRQEVH